MASRRKGFIAAALIYFLGQAFFIFNLDHPGGMNFDESHYVPAAKALFAPTPQERLLASLEPSQSPVRGLKGTPNWEHPPLAKMIVSLGISIFGDRPLGWRSMSTLFGALTLVAFFLIGLQVLGSLKAGVFLATLTLANHLLYVQSRIAMLDTFMFGFLSFAFLFYFLAWIETRGRENRFLGLSGALFGLAMACKWSAIFPFLVFAGICFIPQFFQTRIPENQIFKISIYRRLLLIGILPLGIYLLCLSL